MALKQYPACDTASNVRFPEEEVRALVRRAQAGNIAARNVLVKVFMPLVVHVARRFYRFGCFMEMGDLVQQGCLGLIHAIEKFDMDRCVDGEKVKLSTCATLWIAHSIRREFETRGRIIRLPIRAQREHSLSRRLAPDLEPAHAKPGVNQFRPMPFDVVRFEAMDKPMERLFPTEKENPERICDENHRGMFIAHMLSRLSKRERYILEQRYMRSEGKTLKKIGRELGISGERVRQCESKAIKRLRVDMRLPSRENLPV
jgi:RNA polymerase sigma factor (sigma-70 family)